MSKINHIADLINVAAVKAEEMGAYDKLQFMAWTIGVAVANTHTAADAIDWKGYEDVVTQLDKVRNELATLTTVIQAASERATQAMEAGTPIPNNPW